MVLISILTRERSGTLPHCGDLYVESGSAGLDPGLYPGVRHRLPPPPSYGMSDLFPQHGHRETLNMGGGGGALNKLHINCN